MARKKRLIVFDLDSTLVHTRYGTIPGFSSIYNPTIEFTVHRRPYLFPVFNTLIDFYDIAIWSAGTSEYVQWVVEHVLPEINYTFVWSYDEVAESMRRFGNAKDLRLVADETHRPLDDIVIVDDTCQNTLTQPARAIRIPPFNAYLLFRDNKPDDALVSLTAYLLDHYHDKNLSRIHTVFPDYPLSLCKPEFV